MASLDLGEHAGSYGMQVLQTLIICNRRNLYFNTSCRHHFSLRIKGSYILLPPNRRLGFIYTDCRRTESLWQSRTAGLKGIKSVSETENREPAARFTEAWHAHCLRQLRLQRCTHRYALADTAVRSEGGGGDASSPSDYLWGMEVRS